MAAFNYIARDAAGRPQSGEIQTESAPAAARQLRDRGWRLIALTPAPPAAPGWEDVLARLNPWHWLPPRLVDIELSLSQIGVMLRSGLTLLSALRTVAEQTDVRRLKRIWQDVSERIQSGSSFHQALAAHRCFPSLVVQLVRVGEETGSLDSVVDRAAKALEHRRMLFMQVMTALAYPAIVLIAAIGVTVFMLVKVLPELQKFLSVMGRRLPATTQALLDISGWLRANGTYILGGLCGALAVLYLVYASPPGRLWMDRVLLRVPVIGRVFRLAATASFASAMGLLLKSGITLLDGLRAVEPLHRNRHLATVVTRARERVLQGGTLAKSLPLRGAYMPLLPRMVAVGEEGGTLEDVLHETARFHEAQLQVAIRRLSALVEPAIIIVVGGLVGFVYISFFMALFAAGGLRR